jgi:hypothetical protein
VSYFIAAFVGVLVGVMILVSTVLVKDDSVELIYSVDGCKIYNTA